MSTPHLTTSLTGSLGELEKKLLEYQTVIENWLCQEWLKTPAPLYSSVDLRNAGFKIAPVDTNLFSAGFNNLNPDFIPLGIQAARNTIEQLDPTISKIVIVPEHHTRNLFYWRSVAQLFEIFHKAGFACRIGTTDPDITEATTITLDPDLTVTIEPLKRQRNKIHVDDFIPDLIVINHDMSEGVPEIFTDIEQPISPPLSLGWANRLKSVHFEIYEKICDEFAQHINLDPWLINPYFRNCGHVDFMRREGEECLIHNAEVLLNRIQQKYNQYNIEKPPFLVIKADAGTYGMGIMTIKDPNELAKLNRKQRTRMSSTKGNVTVNKVILQEGVYTSETWGDENSAAEPVVYSIGKHVIGGFYRVHTQRAADENLNAPGMHFESLAFEECCINPDINQDCGKPINRFYAYGVIARLAVLAAAREQYQLQG